jgi:hypothetical protein
MQINIYINKVRIFKIINNLHYNKITTIIFMRINNNISMARITKKKMNLSIIIILIRTIKKKWI